MKIEISKIISNGCGLGWAEGKTFFVPFTIPGEIVEILQFRKEKSYYKATDFEIVAPSNFRREPICDYYKVCGGCSLQHIEYQKQLEIKETIFYELLKQQKVTIDLKPVILTPGEKGIRTRAKVFIKNGKPAFRAYRSNELVEFVKCPILNDEFMELILKDAQNRKGDIQYEFSNISKELIPPKNCLHKTVKGKKIKIYKNSFFQSSEEGAEILCSLLQDELNESKPVTGYDLFSGSGLFSVFMSASGVKTTGMEIVPQAVKSYRENLGNKAEIICADAYKIKKLEKKDIVIADPPREGLGVKLVDIITESSPETIIYISCEPSAFARDTKRLMENNYELTKAAIVDLFPSTHHFEVFSVFKRLNIVK
jgi:23S rRNA (uracil1939-C5)-methyltransferase